ncbi:MAG: heterodisulfide reductase-related iron-sulfur binding cluster [Ilumatobacteraceae bacterium]
MNLGIDADELNTCVQCGLCLSACPTFRITGDETMSPRGRIALMREVQLHDAPLTAEVVDAFETCIQCRGCEPACPSSVPYGHLIEATRSTMASERISMPWWQRLAFVPLSRPRLLRAGSTALAVAQRLHLVPKRFGLSVRLPLRRTPHVTSGHDVYMFTGCVMDAWQRDVHHAGQRVLESAGFGVLPTGDLAPCCGALQDHAGLTSSARDLAASVMNSLEPDIPIIVDSAGCSAAMKDYGHLLGSPEAHAFSARVFDIQEFLALHMDRLPPADPLDLRVAVQDPCHLRHVQGVHATTRTVLAPYVRELVELDDDGLCCGAGGAYSVLQPELAGEARRRKLDSIDRVQVDVVASANPGCSMHLAAGGAPTMHPMQLVDRAVHGTHER